MKYHCRQYQQDDLAKLQILMLELGYSVDLTVLGENIGEIYKKGGEIFITEIDGDVVGSVCVLIDARLAEGVYAEIVSLIVSKNIRGQGVGKELVKEAENWAKTRVNKIRVRANEVRTLAHTFYKNQGYEEIKTQKVFIKML
jgi:GNAT superfamily N-acetyltransferase